MPKMHSRGCTLNSGEGMNVEGIPAHEDSQFTSKRLRTIPYSSHSAPLQLQQFKGAGYVGNTVIHVRACQNSRCWDRRRESLSVKARQLRQWGETTYRRHQRDQGERRFGSWWWSRRCYARRKRKRERWWSLYLYAELLLSESESATAQLTRLSQPDLLIGSEWLVYLDCFSESGLLDAISSLCNFGCHVKLLDTPSLLRCTTITQRRAATLFFFRSDSWEDYPGTLWWKQRKEKEDSEKRISRVSGKHRTPCNLENLSTYLLTFYSGQSVLTTFHHRSAMLSTCLLEKSSIILGQQLCSPICQPLHHYSPVPHQSQP